MKKFTVFSLMFAFMASTAVVAAGAEGLLGGNSGPSSLQQQELNNAYEVGYNDGKNGNPARNYTAGGAQNNGEVIRGAGRGALGGAAMGKLSDGDAGRGAAWGAGAGAIKGAVKKRREAQQEMDWASRLSNAYNQGYLTGMNEANAARTVKAKKQAE